ncbi:unnamed protein product, partial [Porites evermanni]
RFSARLEHLLIEWKLDGPHRKSTSTEGKGFLGNGEKSKLNPIPNKKDEVDQREGTWGVISERISFATFNFVVSYHHLRTKKRTTINKSKQTEVLRMIFFSDLEDSLPDAMKEMFDMEFDFPPRTHCLSRWYGLKEFLVIAPAGDAEIIDNESKCHLLLSSVAIAATNTKCTVPMFAHVLQQWRKIYYGFCIGGGFRTAFQISQLRRIPSQFQHLAGLLEIFKDKLACPVSPVPPVTLTVRFTYILDEWTDYAWPQEPPDPSSCLECKVGVDDLGRLPFGACLDPIRELHLSTTWPCLSEEVIVDNSVYSDLDPCHAPQWSVRAKMSDNPQCLLGEYLSGYITLCHRQESTLQLLNKTVMDDDSELLFSDITQALQRLTEGPHVASLSTAVSRATSRISAMGERSSDEFPIPGNLLKEILKHLFPDADQDLEELEVAQQEMLFDKMENKEAYNSQGTQDKFRGLKTAPEDSLTFFLAVCICIVYHSYGGLRAVAHLWQEFVLEMRYRWENDIFIPRLKLQPPNLGSCLVHQKLQCRKRKTRLHESSRSIAQWTIGTFSVDAKDAGKDKREKSDAAFFSSPFPGYLARNQNPSRSPKNYNIFIYNKILRFNFCIKIGACCAFYRPKANLFSAGDVTPLYVVSLAYFYPVRRRHLICNNLISCQTALNVGGKTQNITFNSFGSNSAKQVTRIHCPFYRSFDQVFVFLIHLQMLNCCIERKRLSKIRTASLQFSNNAANPGCLLEDFVRWYSPFDWIPGPETEEEIEELRRLKRDKEKENKESSTSGTSGVSVEEGWDTEDIEIPEEDLLSSDAKALMEEAKAGNWREEGHLSLRMRIPGNMWVEVWQSARSVPVRRQKRLFDETKEAEKVLHFLAGLKPAEVAFKLFPVLLHSAVLRIEQAGARDIAAISSLLDKVLGKASKLSWEMPRDLPRCEEFVKQLQLCELVVARAHSLRFKFQDALSDNGSNGTDKDVEHFLSALMEKPEVTVIGAGRGPAGRVIHSLFSKQENARMQFASDKVESPNELQPSPASLVQDFPPPTGREYILRTTIPRPHPSSRPCPQRMYCVLTNDEFRLAGAFTDDVIFQ